MAEVKLKAKLVICNVPSKDFDKARRFYSALLGSDDFVRGPNRAVESYNRPLSPDGIDLAITERYDAREGFTCYFAVNNLDQTIEMLSELGGSVVSKPADIPAPDGRERMAQMAVMLDPDGNHVGLVQLGGLAHGHFRIGQFQRPLEPDQVEGLKLTEEVAKKLIG